MNRTRNIALLLAVMVFGFCVYGQAISLTIGSGDFYVNVGDYDYLPYAYSAQPGFQIPGMSFQSVMADYGTWHSMQPFGQVWRPYAAFGWRPYTQGHWNYTQYGPTWQGYEPWAWAGYHYGNWVYSQQYGWVWVPGHEWHPGRVAWSQGYNSIGWMPMPPSGFDYSRGYLSNVGPVNQFTYFDDDFSIGIGFGGQDYSYGGPYYDPRYRGLYYNPSYLDLAAVLWTFIEPAVFGYDNYADYYYGDDFARTLFDRRLVRISSRPIERVVLERIVRQPVQVRQVRVNEANIDGRRVRLVAVEGEEDRIRKHANETVKQTIAPAFAEKGKNFKGENAKTRGALKRALRLENTPARVETVDSTQIVRQAKEGQQRRDQQRAQIREKKRQEVITGEKQGKIKEKKTAPGQQRKQETEEDRRQRSTRRETPTAPTDLEQPTDATRTNEDTLRRERERKSTTRPETEQERIDETERSRRDRNRPEVEEDTQRLDETETERSRREREADPDQEVREADVDEKAAADTEKKQTKKKAKSKKAKSKDKDKDKESKQNQDEPPQK